MSNMKERVETLSPRQLQVMRYVAERLSSKEIGFRLDLSAATVDSHIAAALQRMGLSSRRDAAIVLINLGYGPDGSASAAGAIENDNHGGHHGDNLPLKQKGLLSRSPKHSSKRPGGEVPPPSDPPSQRVRRRGMGPVVVRYLLDGFYISLFFAVMSLVAFGAHRVVIQFEHSQSDPVALFVIRSVSYVLVGLDGIGVITATGFLTYRFIRALIRTDDED